MHNLLSHPAGALNRATKEAADKQQLHRWTIGPATLSPWSFWTLIGLFRHRNRQRWLAKVVRNRLRGSPDALSAIGALAHPTQVPPQGVVPGLIHWEYSFHGRGCCITQRITGEAVDVDFYDSTGDHIDAGLYLHYLRSLKNPEPIEQRLIELHPSLTTILLALDDLKEAELLEKMSQQGVFCLSAHVNGIAKLIDAFQDVWKQPSLRLQAAVAVGDWPAARDLNGELPQ